MTLCSSSPVLRLCLIRIHRSEVIPPPCILFNVQLRQLRWWVTKKKKKKAQAVSTGCATLSLLTMPSFDVHLIQLWYLEWTIWLEPKWGWGLDKCQLADPLSDEDWGKQLEDLAEIISASLIESVHLPLAVQVYNSGLSKITPAPFACLVRSCWQDCVLSSVQPYFFSKCVMAGLNLRLFGTSAGLDVGRNPGIICHMLRHI